MNPAPVEVPARILIAGIDLAWGETKPDGVCLLEATRDCARVLDVGLQRGDPELLTWIKERVGHEASLLAIDAPIVCPNATGGRPVDRETHRHFGRYHAGCHPANLTKCARPARLAAALVARGFTIGADWSMGPRLLAEVYPHPAMIRLFGLPQIVKYKRGPIVRKRTEFQRLQTLITAVLARHFPKLELDDATRALLSSPWTKPIEDQTDAFFCALIGYWHWLYRGTRTQVLGDLTTGFLLVPQP